MINAIIFCESIIIQKQLTKYKHKSVYSKIFSSTIRIFDCWLMLAQHFKLFKMLGLHVFSIQHHPTWCSNGSTMLDQHFIKNVGPTPSKIQHFQPCVQTDPTCWNRLAGPSGNLKISQGLWLLFLNLHKHNPLRSNQLLYSCLRDISPHFTRYKILNFDYFIFLQFLIFSSLSQFTGEFNCLINSSTDAYLQVSPSIFLHQYYSQQ